MKGFPVRRCRRGKRGSPTGSDVTCSRISRHSRRPSPTRRYAPNRSRSAARPEAERAPKRCGSGDSSTIRSAAASVTAIRGAVTDRPRRPSKTTDSTQSSRRICTRTGASTAASRSRTSTGGFAPAVTGVWVKAVHTADSIALRVVWDDRSESPDTSWLTFVGRVFKTLDGDDSTRERAAAWPDQLIVQFPVSIPSGMERPYFLMGSASAPVYQWRWSSAARIAPVAGLARGIDRFDPLAGGSGPAAQAVYDHGQWRGGLSPAPASTATASPPPFPARPAPPVGCFSPRGAHREHRPRTAISTRGFLAP